MLLIAMALLVDQPAANTMKLDDDDRIKCKTELVTGTLAGRKRICHTVKEWRQITDISYNKARDMQDAGLMSPSNGH